jgi:hypothetical protein
MTPTTSETIDAWAAKDDLGFVEIDGRGWVDVQATALKYAKDSRRDTYERQEWEASAGRFIKAVGESKRWCLDPVEVAMLDGAEVVILPWPLPWEGKQRRRGA